jgi:hypothetical protein
MHLGEWNNCVDCSSIYDGDKAKGAAWLLYAIKVFTEEDNLTLVQRAQYIDIGGGFIWGNLGVVEENGGPSKAIYNAYKIYAMVPERRLELQAKGTVDGMASRSSDTIAVILWNYSSSSKYLTLTINNTNLTKIAYEKFIIDQNHSSHWDNNASDELEKTDSRTISDINSYSEEIQMGPYSSCLILLSRRSSSTDIEKITTSDKRGPLDLSIYPNPFNSSAIIEYFLKEPSNSLLVIYNILGEKIATLVNEYKQNGTHEVVWDAQGFPSGVYLIRFETHDCTCSKKLILLK